jgi:hypothetical protein
MHIHFRGFKTDVLAFSECNFPLVYVYVSVRCRLVTLLERDIIFCTSDVAAKIVREEFGAFL